MAAPEVIAAQKVRLSSDYQTEKTYYKALSLWNQSNPQHSLGDNHVSKYFNKDRRAPYQLRFNADGIFVDSDGQPADGQYLYVVKGKEDRRDEFNIFAIREGKWFRCERSQKAMQVSRQTGRGMDYVHHSYVANGASLKGAGWMRFERGRLLSFDNDSGHYQPSLEQMQAFIQYLSARLPFAEKSIQFTDHSRIAEGILGQVYLSKETPLGYMLASSIDSPRTRAKAMHENVLSRLEQNHSMFTVTLGLFAKYPDAYRLPSDAVFDGPKEFADASHESPLLALEDDECLEDGYVCKK